MGSDGRAAAPASAGATGAGTTTPATPVSAAPASGAALAVLLLADGRFPSGGHAHSAGVEAACADGRVTDEASLADYLLGRLHTAGLVEAALAAATTHRWRTYGSEGLGAGADGPEVLRVLDAEAHARIAAPPWRAASRRLGRQLARAAARCWPHPVLAALSEALPGGAHQPVALGAVGVAAGGTPAEVARLAVHHVLATPAQAAVRLLGLDPFAVAALTARMAPVAADVAAAAAAAATGPIEDLPACTSPLVEIAAVEHRTWDVRLFAT
jgi:urease accessory protein